MFCSRAPAMVRTSRTGAPAGSSHTSPLQPRSPSRGHDRADDHAVAVAVVHRQRHRVGAAGGERPDVTLDDHARTSRRAAHPAIQPTATEESRAPHSRPDTGFGSPSANRVGRSGRDVERRGLAVGHDLGEEVAQRGRVHDAVAGGAVHQKEVGAAGRGAEDGVLVGRHLVQPRPAGRRIDRGAAQHRHPPVRHGRHLPRPTPDPPSRRTDGPRRPAWARAAARGRRAPGGGSRRPRRSSSASSREAGRMAPWPRPGAGAA